MPSPFPGMDPYLESAKVWPSFQQQLVGSLYQILLPGLVDRYRAKVTHRQFTTEMPLFTSVIREEHTEELIEIRQRTDNKLVTLIHLASPTNKTTQAGRDAFLVSRQEARNQRANIVEMDLVMQGKPLWEPPRDDLPDWDTAVIVTRASNPDRYELYTSTLQKRLPRFKIPLAADDRDTVLDLQSVFTRSFEQGDFLKRIDYTRDPEVHLNETQRKYIDELLKSAKFRK